jgi:hypothetical protein
VYVHDTGSFDPTAHTLNSSVEPFARSLKFTSEFAAPLSSDMVMEFCEPKAQDPPFLRKRYKTPPEYIMVYPAVISALALKRGNAHVVPLEDLQVYLKSTYAD